MAKTEAVGYSGSTRGNSKSYTSKRTNDFRVSIGRILGEMTCKHMVTNEAKKKTFLYKPLSTIHQHRMCSVSKMPREKHPKPEKKILKFLKH